MRRLRILMTILLAVLVPVAAHAQDDFVSIPDAKFTDVNKIAVMVNNNGYLGTNLPTAQSPPSFEYPLGTNLERMIRGGIWVGAVNSDGDTVVTTGTIDGSFSDPIFSEFVEGPLITERSILRNNAFFDTSAVSEQDYICFFQDTDSTIGTRHTPIPVRITLKTYAWSFQPVDEMVILSYTLENIGNRRIEDIYIGMYAELLTCSKATSQSFPGVCFDRKHYQYDVEHRLVGSHYWDFTNTLFPGWAGFSILGSAPDSIDGKTITWDWAPWDPDSAASETDETRYFRMSNGLIDEPVTDDPQSADTPDPVQVLSVGPYQKLDPGDTLNVVFAAVGGRDWEDFQFHGDWAIQTYENNYQIPLPPPSPGLHVDPGPNSVKIFWDAFPETIPDPVLEDSLDFQGYRLYISRDNVEFIQVSEFDLVDSIGLNTGLEAVRVDTVITIEDRDGEPEEHLFNYMYEATSLKDGFEYFVAVTSFDKGSEAAGVPPLESGVSQNRRIIIPGPDKAEAGSERPAVVVFPNPYKGEALWDGEFARERLLYFGNLPPRCIIRIFTLAGDLVDEIPFDADGYHGESAAAIFDPDFDPPELSGGLAGWDLLTLQDQTIAPGLYVFSVEDLDTGDTEVGKFVVIR